MKLNAVILILFLFGIGLFGQDTPVIKEEVQAH